MVGLRYVLLLVLYALHVSCGADELYWSLLGSMHHVGTVGIKLSRCPISKQPIAFKGQQLRLRLHLQ
jgi:hypothetical protein